MKSEPPPNQWGPRRRWIWAWSALLLVNLVTHLVGLGERAMSHDEGIHAYYSWELAQNGTYVHDPAYHGPLLYHLDALVFLLIGDTDWSARLVPALAGLLVLALVFTLSRYLGEAGAFFAGVLVTISPALLFYGRYLRNDIYTAALALLWILSAFRYLETRRTRWLAAVSVAMALSFAAKETSFIFGAIIGSFFLVLTVIRTKLGDDRWRDSPSGDLALLMFTLALPFAAPVVYLLLGWDPTDFDSEAALRHLLMVVPGLAAVALAIAGLGLRLRHSRTAEDTSHAGSTAGRRGLVLTDWIILFAFFWGFQILLFTMWFQNLPRGLISGIVGSLGYWLGQHEVARGAQPWFYYLLIVGLYELIALVLSFAAGVALTRRKSAIRDLAAAPRIEPQHSTQIGPVPWFLLWWTLASWLIYSMAGEKMPWLVVHMVLPMTLLSGWWLGRAFDRIDWQSSTWGNLATPATLPTVLVIATSGLLLYEPFRGRQIEAIAATTRFLISAVIGAAAVALLVRWIRRQGRREAGATRWQLLGLGCVLALGMLSVRASLALNFRNHELATELMVYAHATPDVKGALREIDELARHAGPGGDLRIAYDEHTAWPFGWYLRNHPGRHFFGAEPTPELLEIPVIIAGAESNDRLWPFVGRGYAKRTYRLLWWPPEGFTHFGWREVQRTLSDATRRQQLWTYILHRRVPATTHEEWPHRKDFIVYFEKGLVTASWGLEASDEDLGAAGAAIAGNVTEFRVEPLGFFEGPYDDVPLRIPAQVAVTPDGIRLVADSGNNRVVMLARDGRLIRILPVRGADTGRPDAKPDEEAAPAGSPETLNEPWGVAALPMGQITVADTWNGRVVTFDPSGSLVSSWGALEIGGSPPVPADRLYGPRNIVYHGTTGELILADTGHHRIVVLGADQSSRVIGGAGVTEGRFLEPVGIAIDPRDGSVLIADTWNRRIQRFASDLNLLGDWAVPGWEGRGAFNKPFLAVDDRGWVYASDPERSRILVFGAEGRVQGALVAAGWRSEPAARPLGIAVDTDGRTLLVADAARSRVWILPGWLPEN